jgi:hypothetical protein
MYVHQNKTVVVAFLQKNFHEIPIAFPCTITIPQIAVLVKIDKHSYFFARV